LGDNFATLRSRQASASAPPGCTPEQFAMKSSPQALRIADRCSGVGCEKATAVSMMMQNAGAMNRAMQTARSTTPIMT
jgi:hypothetical protein